MVASLENLDILVIAPTGMGKSLCFQVPAVAERHGLTLVVSPLLCEFEFVEGEERRLTNCTALMQDQIAALRKLEIPCAMLSSKTSPEEQKEVSRKPSFSSRARRRRSIHLQILSDMESGHPKNRLLYSRLELIVYESKLTRSLSSVTPERLSSAPFRQKLRILHKQQELIRLVVDEAHCISEWGHDFR